MSENYQIQVLLNNCEMSLSPVLEQEVFPLGTLMIHFCLLWINDTHIYTYWAVSHYSTYLEDVLCTESTL